MTNYQTVRFRTDTDRLEWIWRRTYSICKLTYGWRFYLEGNRDFPIEVRKKTIRGAIDRMMLQDENTRRTTGTDRPSPTAQI
jgi:hypothetical protein